MLNKKFKLPIQRLSRKHNKIFRTENLTLKTFSSNLPHPRIGVILSKKTAKSAVKRNELKRAVFNSVKTFISNLSPADYLVIINKAIDKEELQKDVQYIFNSTII